MGKKSENNVFATRVRRLVTESGWGRPLGLAAGSLAGGYEDTPYMDVGVTIQPAVGGPAGQGGTRKGDAFLGQENRQQVLTRDGHKAGTETW